MMEKIKIKYYFLATTARVQGAQPGTDSTSVLTDRCSLSWFYYCDTMSLTIKDPPNRNYLSFVIIENWKALDGHGPVSKFSQFSQ